MTQTLLSGRYRLIERLGAGGMGVVWRAEDQVLHREVAVKTVAGPGVTEQAAARLEREARAAAGLSDNQHVVTVHDFGRDGDTLFIVMALAPGRALDRVLTGDGPPAPAHAVDWARQICTALEAAHLAGIVHRDIKPANAVLGPDGTVRVLDFGIAWFHRDLGLDRLSQAGGVLGSAPWMSPEQARGQEVGPASDLYSLGCLLYQLLTGSPPFGERDALAQIVAHVSEIPESPSAHRPGLPADLDLLVAELLAKSPDHRPASATETAARLGAIARHLGDEETAGRPAAPPMPTAAPVPVTQRPVSRRTVLLGAIGVVSVSTTVVVVPKILDRDDGGTGGGTEGGKGGAGDSGKVGANGELTPRWKRSTTEVPLRVRGSIVLTQSGYGERIVARDLDSGEERWRADDKADEVFTGPGETLYFGVDQSEVHAVESADGSTRWRFAPLGDDDVTSGVSAVATDSTVYVATGQYVFALDASDGTEIWSCASEPDVGSYTGLVRVGSLLLARLDTIAWDVIDRESGERRWTWKFAEYGDSSSDQSYVGTVDDRLIFNGDGTSVIDAATGDLLATYKDRGVDEVMSDHALLLDTETSGVYAWSASDGKKVWSVPDCTAPVLMGEVIVTGQHDLKAKKSRLVGLDAATGDERWSHEGVFNFGRSPVSEPGAPLMLGVVGKSAQLLRLDAATGRKGPVRTLPEKFILSVECVGDLVFAVCADRRMDEEGDWPEERRLYVIDLARFDA